MDKLVSTNPAKNYEIIGEVNISSENEIKEKVRLANKAKAKWKELGVQKRIALLKPIYDEFKSRKDEIASLITKEVGGYSDSILFTIGLERNYWHNYCYFISILTKP